MGKSLYIAEKPSVAQEFAKALKLQASRRDGYLEGEDSIVTWCVGHLVTMSYPEVYDEKYKKWSLQTLPFLPERFLYEVIPSVKKQFDIVKGLLNRRTWRRYTSAPIPGGGRVHLPPGGADGRGTGENKEARLDRFPDGGGNPAGHPGGEGPVGV